MRRIVLVAALAALSAAASAQTVSDMTYDLQTRTSIAADWKIAKGLHLEGEYEMRTRDYLSSWASHRGTLGLTYKFPSGIKAGVDYTYIYHLKSNAGTWNPRHRVSAHVSYTLKAGDWRFSLKEQLQLTHKTGSVNEYEEPVNALALKSRLKASYKGLGIFEPYAYVEMRNMLNSAGIKAVQSSVTGNYANYEFIGYGFYPPYVNRLRGALGVEIKFSKAHALDIYAMEDWCNDRNIDISKDRSTLKAFSFDPSLNTVIGVGYKFSF